VPEEAPGVRFNAPSENSRGRRLQVGQCVLQEIVKQFSASDSLYRQVGELATRLLSENLIAQSLRVLNIGRVRRLLYLAAVEPVSHIVIDFIGADERT
jgi:hypothetical protein